MSQEKIEIEEGDKINVMSKGVVGTFVKVCEAKNIDGEKRNVCLVKIDGKEKVFDMHDIELLEKAPKKSYPIPILVRMDPPDEDFGGGRLYR